ncbi:TetR/AcrR family transcriptional regulator [Micromonospora sp. A3M-1-15]|uniref:TetR/AcrR family transcriptional regulator n=1 Tax=Micromonospora sp. A3M-1-15 TaxID=2962035 RepID=UPI0020B6D377|nr:TetR/AcrR family transcriptional regulator [Micromonospora sp. A3M-1-15]MCP3786461.1 TetR/AcrR family transcriptional regulator [Micromonospora sp. A3M-1-15]
MTTQRRPQPAPVPLPGARPGRDPDRAIKRGPRRVSAEVVAATQRDRLFDGLVQEVATRGYDNARVSDICHAAGVTRPAFYALFTGKEDAFLAAYRHGIAVVSQLMESAYRDAGPAWPDAARAALRTLLEVLASVPAFARMALVEVDAAGPDARRERDALLGSFRRFFADAGPGPVAEGVDRETLVSTVVGGIHATIRGRVSQGRAEELPLLLPVLTYAATAPFLGTDGATRATRPVRPDDGPSTAAPCAPTTHP